MNNINLIFSIIIIILIIILKIYITKKNNNVYKSDLYIKSHKLNIFLYCLSVLIFLIVLILNSKETSSLTVIVNSLSIALIVVPLSINTLYLTSFKDEEKTSHTRTIVTTIYDAKLIKKFNKAGINVIILSNKKINSKITTINEDEIDKTSLKRNLIIKTTNKDLLKKQANTYYEFKDLNDAYAVITHSRGTHDNYIRTIKYNITSYLPLLICYIIFTIAGFPNIYNLLLVLLLKLYTMLISEFIYKKMSYDTDLMLRKTKPTNILIGTQELFLIIIESFCIAFVLSIPYMFTLSQGGSNELANTLFFTIYIYANIFMTYSYVSEKNILVNIFKSLKNIKIIIYVVLSILLTISFNYITYFNTRNIELQNYFSSIVFGLIPALIFELTKFARFITTKRRSK